MEILDTNKAPSFNKKLEPLFEAMKSGKTIKSITCIGGLKNKDNRSNDFHLENFKAKFYTPSLSNNKEDEHDHVIGEDDKQFYMDWVISFEL